MLSSIKSCVSRGELVLVHPTCTLCYLQHYLGTGNTRKDIRQQSGRAKNCCSHKSFLCSRMSSSTDELLPMVEECVLKVRDREIPVFVGVFKNVENISELKPMLMKGKISVALISAKKVRRCEECQCDKVCVG